MDNLFVRNRYYPGKLLHASDFEREQKYGNAKLEFLNRSLHGWGIIKGLEVRAGEKGALYVTAGSAIDHRGRLIVVPEDTGIDAGKLKRPTGELPRDFILGICYEEEPIDRERNLLGGKDSYEDARIAESFSLKAYSCDEWEQCRKAENEASALTEERLLYEDGEVMLFLSIPKVVPADSVFRICIRARTLGGGNVSIGWRCRATLQGAFFPASGKPVHILEEKQTLVTGSLCQEWQICTEESRKQTIVLELSHLMIFRQGAEPVEPEGCQIYIETAVSYEDEVRRYFRNLEKAPGMDWVPLARLRSGTEKEDWGNIYVVPGEPGLRHRVAQSAETELIRRAAVENGIVDIRWRGLLKNLALPGRWEPRPLPQPPADRPPSYEPPPLIRPPEHEPPSDKPWPPKEPVSGSEDWERYVHRGVAVIPIPKHYRKGDTLFSEEISYGFPGEEVLIWVGRMYEEPSYAYWEKEHSRHVTVHGAEELFEDGWYSGWEIQSQALRQEIEAGTFQIALTLSKGRKKKRSREVAISWTAVRLTRTVRSS